MEIKVRRAGNGAIIDLDGALKMGAPERDLRDHVNEVLESGAKNLGINLAGVTEMDSSGIGALVRIYTSVTRGGGKCKFFSAPKRIQQTLKMVRLDSVLDMVEDEAAALASF
jgi:anti-sigma B factor antagonist